MTTTNKKSAIQRKFKRLISGYYADREALSRQFVMSELGVRSAFQSLLQASAKVVGWTFVPEHATKGARGRLIRPDGTLKDSLNLVRGHWEAKDAADDLAAEIKRKTAIGYPTSNIIYEDTQSAVLIQQGIQVLSISLADSSAILELLTQFFFFLEPAVSDFEQAVVDFQARVPDLALGLKRRVEAAHLANAAFRRAFQEFFDHCRGSLNPEIEQSAVDEMIVQHILTERLIREVFDNPEFVRRNVIAVEVEKVMEALTSQSFDRNTYLKDLDRFYVAIERAARTMIAFEDKQHFLNTVYERFFQGYSTKVADRLGVVYTPQPIVDFMCSSVVGLLRTELGIDPFHGSVRFLDPCTGTGNFIVNLVRRSPKRGLERFYKEQLFANEIMLLPYYIAALNIEHAYFEKTGRYDPFEGLCLVDTLDLTEHLQTSLEFLGPANSARVARQTASPITVIIGNPPYNAAQESDNDNNRNRRYPDLDNRIRETYAADSTATLKAQLYDPYVRFFRWATDRLEDRDGIVCFVTNNGFVSKKSFDGFRKHLLKDFAVVYHLDLHGDVRENAKLSGTTHNVFGVQVGVGITLAVKKAGLSADHIKYFRVQDDWTRGEKLKFLGERQNADGIEWTDLVPAADHTWIQREGSDAFARLTPIGSQASKSGKPHAGTTAFRTYSGGVKTNRDGVVFDFSQRRLETRIRDFVAAYNAEVDRLNRHGDTTDIDAFVDYSVIQWDGTLKDHLRRRREVIFDEAKIRSSMYRPFTKKWLYFDRLLNNSVYLQDRFFPTLASEEENLAIAITVEPQIKFSALAVNHIPCLHVGGRQGQVFPLYVYEPDGTRRENVSQEIVEQIAAVSGDEPSKSDVFFLIYGLLHHPAYLERFGEVLRRQIPRIPLVTNWRPISDVGRKLAKLHVRYEDEEPWPLDWVESSTTPLSFSIDKMRLTRDKSGIVLNDSLTLAGIPAEAHDYVVGNRSAIGWLIDQYRNIPGTADPADNATTGSYVIDLIAKTITVSVKTLDFIEQLAAQRIEL